MSEEKISKGEKKVEETIKHVAEFRQMIQETRKEIENEDAEKWEIAERLLDQTERLSNSFINILILYEAKLGHEQRIEEKVKDMKRPTYADDRPVPKDQCEKAYYLNGYNKALSDVLKFLKGDVSENE